MSTSWERNHPAMKQYFLAESPIRYTISTRPAIWAFLAGAVVMMLIFPLADGSTFEWGKTIFITAFFLAIFVLRLVCHKNDITHYTAKFKCLKTVLVVFVAGGMVLYLVPHPAILMGLSILLPIIFFLISLQYETLPRAFWALSWGAFSWSLFIVPLWLACRSDRRNMEEIAVYISINILNKGI
ncbi:MAG: hypothetical protein PHQ27_10770 [Victivallales bacterium]|nr:hypothetical protein [Victivallales bacterium]